MQLNCKLFTLPSFVRVGCAKTQNWYKMQNLERTIRTECDQRLLNLDWRWCWWWLWRFWLGRFLVVVAAAAAVASVVVVVILVVVVVWWWLWWWWWGGCGGGVVAVAFLLLWSCVCCQLSEAFWKLWSQADQLRVVVVLNVLTHGLGNTFP